MADFSHLKKLDANEDTLKEYVFDDVVMSKDSEGNPICPSIWFRPMTDANPIYLNERVRLAVERAEKAQKETKKQRKARMLSSDQLDDDREQDRVLMARTCAVRWGVAPTDKDGVAHDFSEAECLDFLRALPNYIIDPCRGWVQNIYNFVDRGALIGETEQLGN